MIKVIAKFTVQSDKIEKFKTIARNLIEKTRQEAGNISYELCQDVDNPQILTFIEEWESKEALENHMEADHFQKSLPQLKELQAKEFELNTYTPIE